MFTAVFVICGLSAAWGGAAASNTPRATLVTAYFELDSKHSSGEYEVWMNNMLSLEDPMVIFTTGDWMHRIQILRGDAPTVVVPMELSDLWVARNWPAEYWEKQLEVHPERSTHRSYQLYWIWLSKSWFVMRAIKSNPFDSNAFVWCDIGSFRTPHYNRLKLVQNPYVIPPTAMILMAHETPADTVIPWVQKFNGDQVYVAGALIGGMVETWQRFHHHFEATVSGYARRGMFVGEDQPVLQSTCVQRPGLCKFVLPRGVKGDVWFGLQYALHYVNPGVHTTIPRLPPPARIHFIFTSTPKRARYAASFASSIYAAGLQPIFAQTDAFPAPAIAAVAIVPTVLRVGPDMGPISRYAAAAQLPPNDTCIFGDDDSVYTRQRFKQLAAAVTVAPSRIYAGSYDPWRRRVPPIGAAYTGWAGRCGVWANVYWMLQFLPECKFADDVEVSWTIARADIPLGSLRLPTPKPIDRWQPGPYSFLHRRAARPADSIFVKNGRDQHSANEACWAALTLNN